MDSTTTPTEPIALPMPDPVTDWPVDVMQHVLWHFGDRMHGLEPGQFRVRLMLAVAIADQENRAKLRQVFPEIVGAMDEVQYEVGGLERLRAVVSKAVGS